MWRLLFGLLGAVSAVVASTPRVICTSSNPAELSGNVTLTCEFRANMEILQVTWQKKRGKDTQNMVTYSENYRTNIIEQFEKHITVLESTPAKSSITITKLEEEDEACYSCLFNAYLNGTFTGEVCLTDLKPANEVLCSGKGNNLRIDLNPQEIQTRTSVQLIKKKIGDVSTVKGQYSDPSINPTCEFWLEKESGEENQNNPAEDADKFFIECSASGHKKFLITWSNEGQPVSREDNVNTTGNTTTVTSTLMYIVSSLPADHRIICTITLSDAENEAQQQRAWKRYLVIASAGFLFLVILIFILFYYKVWKR
ncbi:uncharacterized protein [Aquarana catesbeiana]|uniref:uncharacterized protein isoform X2 n=1 Tax=Aquarana catesbeiana TaxID=8400 RepID=UPI003CC9DC02